MTSDAFRKHALKLPNVVEQSHMGHPDFRVDGRIFASLGYPRAGWAMVGLTLYDQEYFVKTHPKVFIPVKGKWGEPGRRDVTGPSGVPMTALFQRAAGYQGDALNLPVKNVADALPFYEQRLGFRVVERRTTPVNTAILERDSVRIGLVESGGDPTQDGSFFEVSDIDQAFEELQGRGLKLTPPEVQRSGHGAFRAFFVVAPDGLCYMLGEPAS